MSVCVQLTIMIKSIRHALVSGSMNLITLLYLWRCDSWPLYFLLISYLSRWGSMYKVQCGLALPSHHLPEGVMYAPVGQFEGFMTLKCLEGLRMHTDHVGVRSHREHSVWVFTTPSHTTEFLSKHTAIMYAQYQWIDCTDVTIWLLPVLLLKTEASYPNCSIACYTQWVAW